MIKIIIFLITLSLSAMEPNVPESLKSRVESLPHHTHSVTTLHQTISEDLGKQDVKITIEELKESDGDKDKQVQITRRTLIITHGAVAIVSAIVTAGSAVGIAYAKCHK